VRAERGVERMRRIVLAQIGVSVRSFAGLAPRAGALSGCSVLSPPRSARTIGLALALVTPVSMVSLVSLAALAALAGCGGGGGDDAQPTAPAASQEPPATFIAFSTHFTDFTTWTAFPLGETTPSDGEKAGPRTIYVNRMPKAGSAAFPVGTIVVKAIQPSAAPSTWQVFAMVKRGGGFNAFGATDWEWFELVLTDDGHVTIDWRGISPPDGKGYGAGIKGGACNTCHDAARSNDFVQTPALKLAP